MATWCSGVRSAQFLLDHVQTALTENGIYFQEVTYWPFRSNGGRSNGITAEFNYRRDKKIPLNKQRICVSVYEHWSSDEIDIKITHFIPSNVDEHHDEPSIQFSPHQIKEVVYAIQNFLVQYFNIKFPEEWYVPQGFKGFISINDAKMEYVDEKMMSILMDWLEPDEE